MTVESIREEFLKAICDSVLEEETHVDEEDYDFTMGFFDEFIKENGGWDKLYKDVQTGIENGYSKEQQLELMKAIMVSKVK